MSSLEKNGGNTPAVSDQNPLPGSSTPTVQESLVKTVTTKEEFENILKSAGDKHLFVEFYASWCGPCKLLDIKLQELAQQYEDKVIVIKIDVDELEELSIEYDVTAMPAFIIMKNGQRLEKFFGSKVEQLDEAIEKYLGKPQ